MVPLLTPITLETLLSGSHGLSLEVPFEDIFEDERDEKFGMAGLYGNRWSDDSWSVSTPFILKQINMNRTACLFIWKQHSVIRYCWYLYSNYIWLHFGNKRNNTLCQLHTSLTFSPAKGWDFCCEIVIFLPHRTLCQSRLLICFNRKQVRPFFMFQVHLFSYFGVQKCFVWKRFATMRSYDNMFHGFCSTRKCFQQRLISFRSVLSESDNLFVSSWSNHLLFDRTDSSLRSNWLLSSIELTFGFDRNNLRSKRPSIELTCYPITWSSVLI